MQRVAKHLACGANSIGATLLITTTLEMLRLCLMRRMLCMTETNLGTSLNSKKNVMLRGALHDVLYIEAVQLKIMSAEPL